MNDTEIIEALGDSQAVGRLFGLARNTVTNWKTRGIAWEYRPRVQAHAIRQLIAVPPDFLTVRRGKLQLEGKGAE